MAALYALIMAFLGLGLTAGLVTALVLWAQNAVKKRREVWHRVAQQHGLQYTDGGIQGAKYGQRLHVGTVTRGSGDNRRTFTVVSAQLPMPLDLGLNLRRHGFLNDMFHASVDVQIGEPDFDRAFIVSADEDHRARAILGPKLRQLLLARLGKATFSLGDAGMSVECSGATSDEAWLSWAVELTARAASKLDEARQRTPAAGPLLHHRNAWLGYARAAGLRGQDTPLSLWGRLGDYDVAAHAVRVDRLRYALQIEVRLPTPLAIGLSLREAGLLDTVAVFFGGQDHRLGDRTFDDTFRLKTADPERARAIFDASVRQELMWVRANLGPIILDDEKIAVRIPTLPHEPAIVPRVVHQLTGLAERLSARGATEAVGPYR